jgi:hypothetical protein
MDGRRASNAGPPGESTRVDRRTYRGYDRPPRARGDSALADVAENDSPLTVVLGGRKKPVVSAQTTQATGRRPTPTSRTPSPASRRRTAATSTSPRSPTSRATRRSRQLPRHRRGRDRPRARPPRLPQAAWVIPPPACRSAAPRQPPRRGRRRDPRVHRHVPGHGEDRPRRGLRRDRRLVRDPREGREVPRRRFQKLLDDIS